MSVNQNLKGVKDMIVQVGNVSEFVREVLPDENTVRVSTWAQNEYRELFSRKTLSLDVMGFNGADELVWLHYSVEIQLSPGGNVPWNDHGRALLAAFPDLEEKVVSYLREAGYTVGPGRYAIPNTITPLNGELEIVEWVECGGCFAWRVEEAV